MTKCIHIALVFSLLVSTTGIGVYKHYCQQKLAAITFFSKVKKCCGGKEMPPDCCKDEFQFHQLELAYSLPYGVALSQQVVNSCFFHYRYLRPERFAQSPLRFFDLPPPPLIPSNFQAWSQQFLI